MACSPADPPGAALRGGERQQRQLAPHLGPPLAAECLEIFETGHTLISSLGFPLIDSLAAPTFTIQEADAQDQKRAITLA
jgi:hypothetical protein